MPARVDPITLVEACYDLRASESDWMQNIADAAQGLVGSEHGLIAYHLLVGVEGVRVSDAVQSGGANDVVSRIRRLGHLVERCQAGEASLIQRMQAKIWQAVVRGALREPVDRLFMSEYDKLGPDWMYNLGVPGVRDQLVLLNHHVDGLGATVLVTGISQKGRLRPAQRQMYQRLGAHIKAGFRLRRRLGDLSAITAPEGGAVVDAASARVVHADGDAQQAEQDIALAVYAGASNEEIARVRGVSEATVKNQLDRLYRKLGVTSRVELVIRTRSRHPAALRARATRTARP